MRTLEEATKFLESLILFHLGNDWKLNINKRFKHLYGRCDYLTHIIHIEYQSAIHCTDEHLRQMVLHEIAHGLTHNVGHNKLFKAMCGMIECSNDTPYFEDYASLDYLPE